MSHYVSSGEQFVEPTAFGSFVRHPAVRETIESVLIALTLALLFRFFEAEAYVIPTGSMAPGLQGRHIDVVCPECEYAYQAGASGPNGSNVDPKVKHVACPICRFPQTLRRASRRDHRPFSGDRILVNKFAYDFDEPDRWDVIVFKYPNNGKQNFIKRLVGLPNEGVLIERGDIFTFDQRSQSFEDRRIARKSPQKLKAMLQMVDDTNHISQKLLQAGWPSHWQQWDSTDADSDWQIGSDLNRFTLKQPDNETKWLRYRHIQPDKSEWEDRLDLRTPELPDRIARSIPTGQLIPDHYAYNEVPESPNAQFPDNVGMHWVGDLSLTADVQFQSDNGTFVLELVEGKVKFRCSIDVATGKGAFSQIDTGTDKTVEFVGESNFDTDVRGQGKHKIQFANADDKLFLWIDGQFVAGCEYDRFDEVIPVWSQDDPGDAEPLGVGGSNISMELTRLIVERDIYYVSLNGDLDRPRKSMDYDINFTPQMVRAIFRQPAIWNSDAALRMFRSRNRSEASVFRLDQNQLLPMGDNSPQSNDARIWDGSRFIDASYLLGEALFIYWPHAKTSPLPFWPNFGRMKFIR